jgi:hypothetical protein
MWNAYLALRTSVVYLDKSYKHLQGVGPNSTMFLNPKYFDGTENPDIDLAVKNMLELLPEPPKGSVSISMKSEEWDELYKNARHPVTLTSRVTGESVTVDVPGFYAKPPQNLFSLMATDFEDSNSHQLTKFGKTYRNYKAGRAKAWNNDQWRTLVPSASGKDPSYMRDARRIIEANQGMFALFGKLDIFIR